MTRRILYLQTQIALNAFSEACIALTPKISIYSRSQNHFLFLDIGITQNLFGGENAILLKFEELKDAFEITTDYQIIVDRPEWAACLANAPQLYLKPGDSQRALNNLAIEQLELCGDPATLEAESQERKKLIAFMRRVGMRTIGDFTQLGTDAIIRRFGKLGVVLKEWATGERELLLPQFFPTEPIQDTLQTDEITSLEGLLFYLRQSLVRIEARLMGRSQLAKSLKLTFHLESRNEKFKILDLSEPLQDTQSLLRILRELLNGFTWDSPLQQLDVEVLDTVPATPGQLSLFDKSENSFRDLAQYVARLRSRFGEEAVGFAEMQPSYLPERSWKHVWPPKPPPKPRVIFPKRPLFLYTPPRSLKLAKNWRLTPSENLAVEWWEPGGYRRYFIADTPNGEKLWVFWDCQKGEWFLHGTFD